MTTSRQTCTDHAVCCGRHFHGTGAFDLHRRGGVCNQPWELLNRKGEPMLQIWTEVGRCRLGVGGAIEDPATIWQVAASPQSLQSLQVLKSDALKQGSLL